MKVIVDHDLCIGDGICEAISADVFELRDDGLAYVKDENPGEELMEQVREAVDACPVAAIIIEE